VREGRREEKWYGTAGVPGYFRKPYGKGWALVGDASYNRDPITAQGISDAFIEAEMLATALSTVWSGAGTLEDRLAAHEAARNERVRPMYEFTCQLAALEPPPPEMRALLARCVATRKPPTPFYLRSPAPFRCPISCRNENVGRIMAAARDVEFLR
jgi:2-polyprenyl-6-methoxyphenol hydroxylase-like FAD-dependent oxidoreductase